MPSLCLRTSSDPAHSLHAVHTTYQEPWIKSVHCRPHSHYAKARALPHALHGASSAATAAHSSAAMPPRTPATPKQT